jgi:hypothetical protein
VPETRHLPNINHISILAASILIAYTLAGFIILPTRTFSVQLPGLFLEFEINAHTIVSLLVAGMTATGADWLIREHPSYQRHSFQHWLLPALTAWAIGIILFQQPFYVVWWVTFAVGGTVLTLVLIAEYIMVDPEDVRRIPAIIGLTAISFALFLVLVINLRASEIRLFFLLPTITLASFLTSLRSLNLRLQQRWLFLESAVIAICIAQLGAALNYLKVEPVSFGLFLLGPSYALTSFIGGIKEKKNWWVAIIEPAIVLGIVSGFVFLIA